MNQTDYAALAEDRSRFFWWLAEWFLSPPDAERIASLPDPDTADDSDALDIAWHTLAVAKPGADGTVLDTLGVEFTRLFSGIQEGMGPPPPFESVWREDRLIGESTVAVLDAYSRSGFAEIHPEAGPQDHLGVELKFIALLALREAEAWRADSTAGGHERLNQQRDFIKQHLAAWAPRWTDTIIAQTREPLFAALAQLVAAGLDHAGLELAELSRATQQHAA